VFAPLYFFHRYQTEATIKLIGGLDYNYAVKGSSLTPVERIPKSDQMKALEAALNTLDAQALSIPERIFRSVSSPCIWLCQKP